MTEDIDWQNILMDLVFMECLQRRAENRFPDSGDSEAAYSYAFGRLTDPDYQGRRLSLYSGRKNCSPRGFLLVLYNALLEDYSRKKYGRPRPPAWLTRMGPLWVKVYRLLCLERRDPEDIVLRMQAEITEKIRATLVEAIDLIHARVTGCGGTTGETSHDFSQSEAVVSDAQTCQSTIEKDISRHTLQKILSALCTVLVQAGGSRIEDVPIPAAMVADGAAFSLDLPAEDKLLLRMVYQDGLSAAAAARRLGEKEYTIRRRMKKAVASLRQQLKKSGINSEILQGIL